MEGRRGGLGPGRRAGGGARRLLLLPSCPLEAAARTPGSGPWPRCAARRRGRGADREGGREGELRPLCLLERRGEAGQGGLQFGRVRDWGEPRWSRAAGCRLQPRGVRGILEARPRPPTLDRPMDRGSEEEPFIPPSGLQPFHCQADTGLVSKEQLPDSWQNNGDPACLGPLSLGQNMGVEGGEPYAAGIRTCRLPPATGCSPRLSLPRGGVRVGRSARLPQASGRD